MFLIKRDAQHGALTLTCRDVVLPVNEPYLEELLLGKGIALAPGASWRVDSDTAKDAIEEALSSLGHAVRAAEQHRTELLGYWFVVVQDPRHPLAA